MKNMFSGLTLTDSTLKITALVIGITSSMGAMAGNRHQDNRHVFTDYARVVHVEPKYRTVTKRTPQRTCHAPTGHRQQNNRQHNTRHYNNTGNGNGNNGHRNNNHGNQYHTNNGNGNGNGNRQRQVRPEAVFIGGVIGGAIGHELSKSVNGRSNAGVTLAGAAIGAGLVAGHQHNTDKRYGNNRLYVTSTQHQQRRHKPEKRHQQRRCTTTEHVQRVREISGYHVTYRFRGKTFQTHTDHHPGDKIPVRVAVSTR